MAMGGGAKSSSAGALNSEINVTPMVDIMLVLLIIFMVITPFLQQGVTVAIPRDMNSPDVDPAIIKESSVVISIPNNGEYYMGKDRVSKEDLGPAIKQAMEKKAVEDQIVYIKSGVNVSYGDLVDVIDVIRRKGEVQQIGLVADKRKKGAAVAPQPAT
ncbi:MAG: biopolymer transport protein TolR [Blastocatellia bacterium]|jgi:biopolymer transport protein ExbD/biopolymer transport protein TolR|nr:biopolymer transport protein TolR [Blastocatellia bacterium]